HRARRLWPAGLSGRRKLAGPVRLAPPACPAAFFLCRRRKHATPVTLQRSHLAAVWSVCF
ncbi:hypothetical protein, partial [Phenylobacterium sp.]|uniref:hypothetical protein n=1 Tax=Phenylobacterium sp. TaxID=1871053 RepID=UPI0035B03038